MNYTPYLPPERRLSNPYLARDWPRYIVGPDMQRYVRRHRDMAGGVYFLFVGDALTYIGQASFIPTRIEQHRNCGRPFDSFGFVNVPADLMLAVEIAYIHALRPAANSLIQPPMFLQHDRIVEAIVERWKSVPLLAPVAEPLVV